MVRETLHKTANVSSSWTDGLRRTEQTH